MAQHTTSDDQQVSINFEEFIDSGPMESYTPPVEGVPPGPLSPVAPENDASTFSTHSLAIRSHSFGEQSPGPQLFLPSSGGRRPRAQSDNTVFRSQISFHFDHYDTFAVADDDLPSSNLPPDGSLYSLSPLSTSPLSPDQGQTNALWRIRDGSNPVGHPALSLSTELFSPRFSGPASDASSPSLLSPDPGQTNAEWSIRHESNASGPPTLSPNPGLLSPWTAGPGSDASSIRSSSSSPSRSHFFDPSFLFPDSEFDPSSWSGGSPDPPRHDLQTDLHDQSSSLDEEPTIRGRLVQRRERRKSRHLSSIGSVARVLFEDLSLVDRPSADRSHYNDPTAQYHPQSATHSIGAASSSPTEAFYGHRHGSAISPASSLSNLEGSFVNLPGGLKPPSFDAGRSRSRSKDPVPVDAVSHGDRADKSAARESRRRHASPYPAAGPSMSQVGGNRTEWSLENPSSELTYDFAARGLDPSDAQALFTTNPSPAVDAAGSSSSSFSWNAGQPSQEGDGDAVYRPSVATPATRRASNRRRKDPSKRGAHICYLCGADFTALHNLNFHIDSHLSRKNHECRECRQRFGTPQVLEAS
ncbi:hypothetical protein MSAN_00323500 [Mycena sanguinolenta]|uniref:C2H2-type domain-containing protein n=1 Tax=Mycena sanguinolenta TaxID=230812 RepID=A0A8H7DHD6_9AGAR|nr:hypothetical protein MSAN_00323500 [Mycena sanguinolenta]